MLEEWRAKDDDASLGNRPSGRLRELIIEELEPYVKAGKVMERTDMFRKIVSDTDLDTARASHQTTCILFQGRILSNAASKLNRERGIKVALDKNKQPVTQGGYMGAVNVSIKGTNAKAKASLIGHGMQRTGEETGRFAWWEAHESMPKGRRPKKGDIYVLHVNENRQEFSHVGFFLSHDIEGDHEVWHTMDGGQGKSSAAQEAFEVRHRKYIPGKNLLEGEPNQSDKYRWVLGWVDVDQLEKSPVPKTAAQNAAFVGQDLAAAPHELGQRVLATAGDRLAVREQQRVEALLEQRLECVERGSLDALGVVAHQVVRDEADLAVLDDRVPEREDARSGVDVQRVVVRGDRADLERAHARDDLVAVVERLDVETAPFPAVQPRPRSADRNAEVGDAAGVQADGRRRRCARHARASPVLLPRGAAGR